MEKLSSYRDTVIGVGGEREWRRKPNRGGRHGGRKARIRTLERKWIFLRVLLDDEAIRVGGLFRPRTENSGEKKAKATCVKFASSSRYRVGMFPTVMTAHKAKAALPVPTRPTLKSCCIVKASISPVG